MKYEMINYFESHSELILKLSYNLVLAVIVFLACRLLSNIFKKSILNLNARSNKFDATLVPIMCEFTKYVLYCVGIVVILDIFGVTTTSIIALLGAAGIAVGFALKDTLSNIAAGIMLLVLRPFGVGDSIECGSIEGAVKEINFFTTIIESADGLFISAPNGAVWGSSIKNYSRNKKRRLEISVGVSYSDSLDQALGVLQKIIAKEPRFLTDPEPQTMVISMGDSSVNIQLRGWVSSADYWQTLWDLNKQVKEEIETAGLSIPFPQRDIHLFDQRSS